MGYLEKVWSASCFTRKNCFFMVVLCALLTHSRIAFQVWTPWQVEARWCSLARSLARSYTPTPSERLRSHIPRGSLAFVVVVVARHPQWNSGEARRILRVAARAVIRHAARARLLRRSSATSDAVTFDPFSRSIDQSADKVRVVSAFLLTRSRR